MFNEGEIAVWRNGSQKHLVLVLREYWKQGQGVHYSIRLLHPSFQGSIIGVPGFHLSHFSIDAPEEMTDNLAEVFYGAVREAYQLRVENKSLKQRIVALETIRDQGVDAIKTP